MPMRVSAPPWNAAVASGITTALQSAMLLLVSSPNQSCVAVEGGGGIAGTGPETEKRLLMAGLYTRSSDSGRPKT